ncbi:MAG: alpha/beta hydrolase [Myxococcota bacterium]
MHALVWVSLLALAASDGEGVFRRKVLTSDRVALALYRYVPPGGGRAHPPVLLVPELGFGREAFDLRGRGLAPYLVSQGREVYVLEPRGHGKSSAPPGWRLAEIVERDLPAALEVISRACVGRVDVVAHGFGGTLVLAAAAKELAGKMGRIVALSTPAEPELPNRHTAAVLRAGGKLSALATDPEGAAVFHMLYTRGGQLDAAVVTELRATGLSDLSGAAARDLLRWMEKGDLPLADGSTMKQRLAALDRPTLLFLPLLDNFAHPEFASPLRELAKGPVQVRVLSRLELFREDYTHLSMLHGQDAPKDVFAPALKFLNEKTK